MLLFVGVTGFEPATTRPPDAYSNRAELHPAWVLRCKGTTFFSTNNYFESFFSKNRKIFSKFAFLRLLSRIFLYFGHHSQPISAPNIGNGCFVVAAT